jgi:DNA-binding transcriptional MerR regulator
LVGVELKIDELAQRAGTTSRNVRAYQARGLIPPPVLRGRTGYYGEEHLRRLELIGHLQDRGFSLAAIAQTLDAWSQGGDLRHLLGFHHVITAPWSAEEPLVLTLEELLRRFPEAEDDPSVLTQAVDLGLIEQRGEEFVAPSPALLDAGRELVRAGIGLQEIFDLVKAVRADVADIAGRFVELIGTNLIEPVAEGKASPEQVSKAGETLQTIRPIALEVVRAFLQQELGREADERLREFGMRISEDTEAAEPA